MKNLYIDFDGVMVDSIPLLYDYLATNGVDKNSGDFDQMHQLFANYDFRSLLASVDIINDAFKQVKEIIASKRFNVHILTHINSLDEGIAKVEYLQEHVEGITIILVPKQLSKTKMVGAGNAILIDDYAGNLREWQDAGGEVLLFSRDLEDKGFEVIDNLRQVLELK